MTDDLRVKIAAYIAGNLPAEEIKPFEKTIANDAELREEVALEKQLYLHLNGEKRGDRPPENEHTEALRVAMRSDESKELRAKILNSGTQYRNRQKKQRNFRMLLVAAAITALLIVGNAFLLSPTQTSGDLFDQYYRTEDLPSFRKRGTDTSTLQEAITFFNNEKYEDAIGLLNTYMNKEEGASVSLFIYIGISHTAIGEETEAIVAFDQLINSTSIDRTKGLWFKALSYLKLDNKTSARETLEILTDKKGFNYIEAIELLKAL